ncbi:hypothetical protein ABB37_07826 [Leptomonas pyrrhocoris]|uniref:Uncharacterized protein n=1 Tax=Leptomonas pyrrhocoris TaxID=157538 RepID=A0A0M9FUY3_LEPPY|nr:hypothetical protein ABB37_07826 [Leptomonas pyrrhocoris]KPA76533.1 hypothetical protein ABB37_07826 [Leptomonas pyrrhocoris]|eukprot:XP_015654972.1 hypothetical protein ABB37_07826 [Leptomonas pyrrhocoris]
MQHRQTQEKKPVYWRKNRQRQPRTASHGTSLSIPALSACRRMLSSLHGNEVQRKRRRSRQLPRSRRMETEESSHHGRGLPTSAARRGSFASEHSEDWMMHSTRDPPVCGRSSSPPWSRLPCTPPNAHNRHQFLTPGVTTPHNKYPEKLFSTYRGGCEQTTNGQNLSTSSQHALRHSSGSRQEATYCQKHYAVYGHGDQAQRRLKALHQVTEIERATTIQTYKATNQMRHSNTFRYTTTQ